MVFETKDKYALIISIIAIIISVSVSLWTWHSDHDLNERIFELEKHAQYSQENETNAPPDVKLTQDWSVNSFKLNNKTYGEMKLLTTFYFDKYNERKFTVDEYSRNITLDGKEIGETGCGGFELRFSIQGIRKSDSEECEFTLGIEYYSQFFRDKYETPVREIVIDHILVIKDNYNNRLYRGDVACTINNTFINRSTMCSKFNVLTYNWTQVK